MLAASRTRPTPIPPTTSTSRGRSPRATASTSTSSGSSPRSAAGSRTDPVLPIPSNAHWLPLATFIQAPFIAVLGPTAIASALPMVLIGSLAAPLTWFIARDAGALPTSQRRRRRALGASPRPARVFMAQPENFAILQPLVAGDAVAHGPRAEGRRRGRTSRAGLLVGPRDARPQRRVPARRGAIGLVFVIDRGPRAGVARPRRRPPARGAPRSAASALYLLVVGPVVGPPAEPSSARSRRRRRPAPRCGSARSASGTASPPTRPWRTSSPRARGRSSQPRSAGSSRARQLRGDHRALVLVPFLVVGRAGAAALGRLRCRGSSTRSSLFAGATFLFPLHVPGGAFIHTAIGLAPHAYILSLEGVAALRRLDRRRRPALGRARRARLRLGDRRRSSSPRRSLFAPVVQRGLGRRGRPPRQALAAELDRAGRRRGPTGCCRSTPAGSSTGPAGPGVVTPDDPIEMIESVAQAYEIRWLVLERGERRAPSGLCSRGDAAGVDRAAGLHGAGDGRRAAAPRAVPRLRRRRDDIACAAPRGRAR